MFRSIRSIKVLRSIIFSLVLGLLLTGIAYGVGNQVFNAGSGIEITTDTASDIDISTQATTGGGVSVSSRGGTGSGIYVNTSNNVGIGTTGPGYKLDVAGGVNASFSGGYPIFNHNNTNSATYGLDQYTENGVEKAFIGMGGSTQSFGANAAYSQDGFSINMDGAGVMNISNRGTQRTIYLNTGSEGNSDFHTVTVKSGDVGIGDTTPSYKLDVSGTGQFTSTLIVGTPTAASHAATKSYVDTVAAGGTLWTRASTNTYLTNSGDKVGIGTTSPDFTLNLYRGDVAAYNPSAYNPNQLLDLEFNSGVGNYGFIHFRSNGSMENSFGVVQVGNQADFVWQAYDGSAYGERMRLTRTGNVGIGNTSPDTKLRVDGTVRIGAGNYLSLLDAAGSERGYFQASGGLIISTSGGEPIVFKDGGLSGDTNMTIGGTGAVNIPGTLTFYGSQRIWNGDNSYIYIRSNSSAGGVRFQNSSDQNVGYVYGNTSNFGLLNSGGNWAAYFDNSSNVFYTVASYGRTAHGTGYLAGSYNNVGANDTKSNPIYVIGTSYAPTDTSLSNMYGIGYSHGNFWGSGSNRPTGWGMYVASSGTIRVILDAESGIVWALDSLKAPLFYDTDDQNYYVDPHNVSHLNDLRLNIVYDRANTGYYMDPADISRLNAVNSQIFYMPSDHLEIGGNRANDDSYEWVGWYSGSNRSAITIWDGAWNACATDRFCIIGESHQLTFQSLGHNVLVYDNLDVTNAVTASAFYYSSDASLKFDIQPAAGLEMVRKLDGVTFRWKDTGAKSAGLIAQDVEKVLPEAVSIDAETGKKTLNPAVFTGYMVEAIKELDAKVQKLETENAELRDRLERIER